MLLLQTSRFWGVLGAVWVLLPAPAVFLQCHAAGLGWEPRPSPALQAGMLPEQNKAQGMPARLSGHCKVLLE